MKKIIFWIQLTWLAGWILPLQAQEKEHKLTLDKWQYIQIDDSRDKWGDYANPDWLRYFGLDMADVTDDGYLDIVAGRRFYRNPGNLMEGKWEMVDLGMNVDGILFVDVDGDEFGDIIAQALPAVYWFEAQDREGMAWKGIQIAEVPATSHVNSQGFERQQIVPGGKEEILIAGSGDIYCIEVPDKKPEKGKWPTHLIGVDSSDEGIGVGDIDGDGLPDIAAGRKVAGAPEPLQLVWWRNPGTVEKAWLGYVVGETSHAIDRVEVGDVDGDQQADIIIAEERYPGKEPDSNLFWFKAPDDPINNEGWQRQWVTTQFSMNNLDVKDMNRDGHLDLVTCEHKGPTLGMQVWLNDGKGQFSLKTVDSGKESHLGAQVADMDQDGDLDIVSVAWDNHKFLHLWRNEAIASSPVKWRHLSSADGTLPVPTSGRQQTASLVADVDQDGDMDIFITERTLQPSVTWLRYHEGEWQRYLIDNEKLRIEAGSASHDIDGDGDLDIVFAGESQSNNVWWWENPYPNYDPTKPWVRRTIKKSGANKHHDQMFGDFDGDGQAELVFWNQQAYALFLAEIPENPKEVLEWDYKPIYTYSPDSEMYPTGREGYPGWKGVHEHEGLAKADIDGDGVMDIVGGGRWFKYDGEGGYIENIVDASYVFTRSAAADFIEGGRPEILLVVGDGMAPLMMYEWHEGTWEGKQLTGLIDNGHTLQVMDFNGDGHMDIFSAEMRFGPGNPDAKTRILLGDGKGNFKETHVAVGYGIHEGRVADLDGDGDLDVLGKPYSWKTPRLDIWLNEGK